MAKIVTSQLLTSLEAPIHDVLQAYEAVSEGALSFDLERAQKLEVTSDKPNSARSATDVEYLGETAGKLFVIAFEPGDGTGDESGYNLKDLYVDVRDARNTKRVPRNKTGIHSEAHLTVVSHKIDEPNSDPVFFQGKFDLLGLDGKFIKKIGNLGQAAISTTEIAALPTVTYTVGYRDGRRFGDPHAVFSSREDAVQVAAFLALSDDFYQKHPDMLERLHPHYPDQQ